MDKKYKIYTMFVLFIVALTAPFSAANATQCIWNKSGFVVKARWYDLKDMKSVTEEKVVDGVIKTQYIIGVKEGRKPVQVDQWPTAQGRCTRGANANKKLYVVLSVVDGKIASDFVKIGGGVAAATIGAATGAAASAGCAVATAGLACPAVVAGIGGYTAAVTAGLSQIPDAKEVFNVSIPSTTHYLDVWGTVWEPQVGKGGVSPGELVWAKSRAHDKGCSNDKHVYHVRCEFRNNGQSSLECPDMTSAGKFKGKKISGVKRLGDRAWTEVKVNGC